MRYTILASIMVLIVACKGGAVPDSTTVDTGSDTLMAKADSMPVNTAAGVDTGNTVHLVPLTGSGLRFDGVYHYADHKLQYYMRFFERGSAAFVGGMEKNPGELATILTIDVPSGWNQVHNCPVVQRNDSLFIHSVGVRGSIDYFGKVRANGDSVHFVKVSHITGTTFDAPYGFIPDPTSK